eukprot:CAMPEP_0185570306 /NCGR_PEP_ID=MMETSP0434-20130131/2670_1 /TAXON_ID=626734 ORGANISM="Favella taraikaensis, Strain Fe Narragansett Bay" /NCGR_SAMPLE_ID=MMETSP0434 /ASSEMBLY_ACC=CAM_ASM_000379 /LENGTH=65 /DNA_ID=CAMNT_0028185395 /DNA_START=994 /DNA_END=1191 /DNA_ORIENTATION=-
MSGLRHAQRLMDSTQVQTIGAEPTEGEHYSTSLPNLVDPKMSSLGEDTVNSVIPGGLMSEEELLL